MKYAQRLTVTPPFRTAGICLEVEGCELLGVQIAHDPDAQSFSRFRRWAGLRFSHAIEVGQSLDLNLELIGAPDATVLVPPERIRWLPAPAEPQLIKQAEVRIDELTDSLLQFSEDAAVDEIKGIGRQYFSRLDRATNPNMALLEPSLIQTISDLFNTLKARVLARVAASESAHELTLAKHPLAPIQAVSKLMIGIMESTFGAPLDAPERLLLIGRTHDAFSWGQLFLRSTPGIRVPNTAPDGAAIFLFPEFAQLAIESDVDADTWRIVLPILTRMPALYLRVHRLSDPTSVPRAFESYGYPPLIDVSEAELMAYANRLASSYDGMEPSALGRELGRLAAGAFL